MIGRIAIGALILLFVLAGGFYLYLRSSLPQVEGRITVQGINAPVTIARDADGVPLITAGDDADAAFGLGFAHAQDRLFQMETMRRYGAGRLAEIFGDRAVGADRQMRVLGLYRLAEASFSHLSAPVQRSLEAYAAGVNAFLATHRGALPPEFQLLRFAPEPWRPADSLVWGKLMDLELTGNYRKELLRARLARHLSPEQLGFLYPTYPKEAPTTLAELAALYRNLPLDPLHASLAPKTGPIYASNNWVVDGAHSASGKPLLSNDPHLGFSAPGVWYLARLRTPEREIAGGTAPGVPLVVIGHNHRIAWGFTTTASDVADLFIEKLDPDDPGRYLAPWGSAAFEIRQETIAVRDAAPVAVTVRSTRHGPVLSDVLPAGTVETGYVLALAATFLTEADRSAEALWFAGRARDWGEFRAAFENFVAPQQNIVFGDASGEIGFIAPGHIPIRRNGNGWLPMPGWTGEYDWTGLIPFAGLPQGNNPALGRFVSANNKIVPDSYPYFLSRDWDLPNRAERINERLAAEPLQSVEASAAIQADTLSIAARRLTPLMSRIAPRDEPSREAIERLWGWDFRMDAEKVEPLLFTAWLREFARAVFIGRLGEAGKDYWNLRPEVVETILTRHPEWCAVPAVSGSVDLPRAASPPAGEGRGGIERAGNPAGSPQNGCDALLAASLDDALAGLRESYGPDMAAWRWARAHVATFPNPVFSRIPVLRDWFDVAIPTGGGFDTVDRGSMTIRDDEHPFRHHHGAGLRIVTDLADPAGSRMIAAPGQSGNPLSPHYSDLLQRWRDFDYLVPGKAVPAVTLTLEPAR
ncbi:MAG: penicillin acylase family protein [Alphaproteobacteria bacterium]